MKARDWSNLFCPLLGISFIAWLFGDPPPTAQEWTVATIMAATYAIITVLREGQDL